MAREVGDQSAGPRDGSRCQSAAMDCDEAVRQLYGFLDGELTEERRQQIALHLDDCAPCAGAAGFEAELRVVIASRCRDHVPDSLIVRVAAALDAEAHGIADPGGALGAPGGSGMQRRPAP